MCFISAMLLKLNEVSAEREGLLQERENLQTSMAGETNRITELNTKIENLTAQVKEKTAKILTLEHQIDTQVSVANPLKVLNFYDYIGQCLQFMLIVIQQLLFYF